VLIGADPLRLDAVSGLGEHSIGQRSPGDGPGDLAGNDGGGLAPVG
jgi:hypothetical protein